MNEFIVIGTNPPCPRCSLLTNVLNEKVKELHLSANVIHLCYTDSKAKDFAKKIGFETGTAKDVAKKLGIEILFEDINEIIINSSLKENIEYAKYNHNSWSFELDEFLRNFEKKATSCGILMTPILIVNGEVKHSGSIPRLSYIEYILRNLK